GVRYSFVRVPRWVGKGRHRLGKSGPALFKLGALIAVGALALVGSVSVRTALGAVLPEVQPLDGSGNNRQNVAFGKAGVPYSRVADANYADGHSAMVKGPDSRMVSNRVFNDVNQNIFSENQVSRWEFVWGQFLDHDMGHRDEKGEMANLGFNKGDPLEAFTDNLGKIPFTRSKAAPGTGVDKPREQVNMLSSFIDASNVYGTTNERLEWLRAGPFDGNMANNSALLMLPGGQLPRRDARGDVAKAPEMD